MTAIPNSTFVRPNTLVRVVTDTVYCSLVLGSAQAYTKTGFESLRRSQKDRPLPMFEVIDPLEFHCVDKEYLINMPVA